MSVAIIFLPGFDGGRRKDIEQVCKYFCRTRDLSRFSRDWPFWEGGSDRELNMLVKGTSALADVS